MPQDRKDGPNKSDEQRCAEQSVISCLAHEMLGVPNCSPSFGTTSTTFVVTANRTHEPSKYVVPKSLWLMREPSKTLDLKQNACLSAISAAPKSLERCTRISSGNSGQSWIFSGTVNTSRHQDLEHMM
ncbi:protein STPG3 isoform X2 [Cygnus olor]|uniref:protein STPG3 isoform X2 n=1 Tax=Cygnus olor TaxID=8869 RepID=UPI001ADE65BD|nr:protein STPG3 isoform X2 [Cygnus olor]